MGYVITRILYELIGNLRVFVARNSGSYIDWFTDTGPCLSHSQWRDINYFYTNEILLIWSSDAALVHPMWFSRHAITIGKCAYHLICVIFPQQAVWFPQQRNVFWLSWWIGWMVLTFHPVQFAIAELVTGKWNQIKSNKSERCVERLSMTSQRPP